MTVATSIKKAMQRVGVSYTIVRDSGNITGEYAIPKINAQVTKPFIREFFLEVMLAADSVVAEGDLVLLSDGRYFLLMNKTPDAFKDAIHSYNGICYKCNVLGALFRPSQATVGYANVTAWATIKSGVRALQTEAFYGNMLEPDIEIGLIGRETHDLYLPHAIGIAEHDRWSASSASFVSKTSPAGTTAATKEISAAYAPVSDVWTVTFSSPTAFAVAGAKVGAVGSGTVGALFTNRYFSIPANFFTGTWANGNTYIFRTAAEYYEVTEIKTRRFPGVDLAQLGNDTR